MTFRARLIHALALERNVTLVAVVMLIQTLGENLWISFVPKYLEHLAAPVLVIGLYGTLYDLLDGIYQYPGGRVSDRIGRTRALMLFIALAALGSAIYAFAPSWPWILGGLLFVMAWHGMASPSMFAIIGDVLPREQRTMAFTVQALLRRTPMAIAPIIGGSLIAAYGITRGMRSGLILAIVLAAIAMFVLRYVRIPTVPHERLQVSGVWRTFPQPLRTLLLSDIIVRTCEGLVNVFLVIYATTVIGISAPQFGVLIAIHMVTAMLIYLPAAKLADRIGRKPLVTGTFLAFALFPLAVVASNSFAMLILAYVIAGLREIGEPARKALIMDLGDPRVRGRTIGLYYLIRSTAVAPAAAIGGLLWRISPELPFYLAAAIGLVGTVVFVATVREEYAV
ncbi:MAG TPA: MFS transporter [Thermoanaerobaculia bacterium]|jgi:MFS family permease|nr:MFS transporter [Thermoanaerobaculia bacterium]